MKRANNGGPAFPITIDNALGCKEHQELMGTLYSGLTIRDYFAIKAMRQQPLFPRSLWQAIKWAFGITYDPSTFDHRLEAKQAYLIADSMLEARK